VTDRLPRASAIGNTYRISNDISKGWASIWRITNEVVPYYKWTKPGAFADMDMLTVGLGGLTPTEERFHFALWAINKSPLIIGASVAGDNLPADSKAILSNKEVIAINQDPLGKSAQLVRRNSPEQYDIWTGELSGNRRVVAITNWKNATQTVNLDLRSVSVASATTARDVWAAKDLGHVSGQRAFQLAAHELKLLVLSGITPAEPYKSTGYYPATAATRTGSASVATCGSGQCLPGGKKVTQIGSGASVTVNNIVAKTGGKKTVAVDFIQYEIVYWTGDNTRTFAISVNGGPAKHWAFPISGGNWFETGRLTIELDGFMAGEKNSITFKNVGTAWSPDLVGVEMLE
jgi:alpha-galactosidase